LEEAIETGPYRPHEGSLLASGAGMDASAALGELVDVSTQVVEAVVLDAAGRVEAVRSAGDGRTGTLAGTGAELLAIAARIRPAEPVERVQVDLGRGSLVVVSDGERTIVATTVPRPTDALVAHDLRAVLRRIADGAP
jgi:hypothetical protein